eukprot:CAMPEP_0116996312 /NCGR_PEP_ID=MMETSP0472-20121206/162_1 /TAXON_ID=693140 ORGANISM="Tiarina fusus, Strain LIS" /NCGR_SAMPLE_ID=MMETSP0472 /ASSEMBLY_ACC=CAM_ASM_000603 /LENGTH=359 /DNA_ID=CAMNT_0004694895 /DNA_START=258 /DNA_END=1338 /DNA_ORIENTATION=-
MNQLWGSAAVPEDTGLVGARGNAATCSAQGFIIQLAFVIPSYYVALSLVSYFSIRNKFQTWKYRYIEKWIHVGVFLFPIGSALYLLRLDAYNHVIIACGVASEPVGCGDQSDYEIECTRGPQNIGQIQRLFLALPIILIVTIPTIVMLVLYCQVRKQSGGKKVATSFAKQSSLYLFAQYWAYLFRFLDAALVFSLGKYVFATNLLANFIESLIGLWTMMVYLYFRTDDRSSRSHHNEMSISFATTQNDGKSREFSVDGSTLTIAKPAFSIFDGTNIADRDSPWAAFLLDEGEDDEYDENNAEYDDENHFDMITSKQFVVKPSRPPAMVRDSATTVDTVPNSIQTLDIDAGAIEGADEPS